MFIQIDYLRHIFLCLLMKCSFQLFRYARICRDVLELQVFRASSLKFPKSLFRQYITICLPDQVMMFQCEQKPATNIIINDSMIFPKRNKLFDLAFRNKLMTFFMQYFIDLRFFFLSYFMYLCYQSMFKNMFMYQLILYPL